MLLGWAGMNLTTEIPETPAKVTFVDITHVLKANYFDKEQLDKDMRSK